ncbi:polysaccharide deacetylase family protein [Alkalicella caledoniensis]|uniref:Polysaccharide deacetylase family protein n=1 Tax=Alkalicella caledoniensis TaxID=2731377 RepID=A0A7G9W950_ALKCA|nr:polysaccharide deacetylase family protein [Alkalicella caledoniensis]QNO15212.1 polysaccharide deacetylase family protein [Alkalicella caledoniensis]
MRKRILVLFVLALLLITGCTGNVSTEPRDVDNGSELENPIEEEPGDEIEDEKIDFEAIRPNEAGQIMVLMYHQIGPEEKEWIRTPDNFRKDLQVLYDNGYRLVSLKDVLKGNISVEAGYTPVVITFDDGTEGQFRYIKENGQWIIDPDSAVGILLEMNDKNPGFGTAATFYVNTNPFRQPEFTQRKLEELIEFGMDIGNHTYTHPNLARDVKSKEEMQRQLGMLVKEIQSYLPDYELDSLALPFGGVPPKELFPYAVEGEHEGTPYHNLGILLVGSHPSHSPFSKDFDPHKIPRIRGEDPMEYGYIYYWMEYFERNPHLRYISDGNPNYITVPEDQLDKIDTEAFQGKTIRTY